jgi:hypothetical protein
MPVHPYYDPPPADAIENDGDSARTMIVDAEAEHAFFVVLQRPELSWRMPMSHAELPSWVMPRLRLGFGGTDSFVKLEYNVDRYLYLFHSDGCLTPTWTSIRSRQEWAEHQIVLSGAWMDPQPVPLRSTPPPTGNQNEQQ